MTNNTAQLIFANAFSKATTRGISEGELFEEFPWLASYRDENASVDILDIEDLADHLHTSVEFLLLGEEDEFNPKIGARHQYVPLSGKYVPESWDDVQEVLDLPKTLYRLLDIDIPESRYEEVGVKDIIDDPETAAPYGIALRNELIESFGEDFLLNLPSIIEEKYGIDVFVINAPVEFSAYSCLFPKNGRACIIVSKSDLWYRTIFSIIHELGHVLFGEVDYFDDVPTKDSDQTPVEKWLNRFAANVIYPAEECIRRIDWKNIDEESLVEFLWTNNVSSGSACTHLRKIGLSEEERQPVEDYNTKIKKDGLIPDLEKYIGKDCVREKKELFFNQRVPQWIFDNHKESYETGRSEGFGLARIYNKSIIDM